MKKNKLTMRTLLAGALLAAPWLAQAASTTNSGLDPLANKVRHELVMLPFLSVFDNLAFSVSNGEVTLSGQVTRPILRSDAENVVKRLEGITAVHNMIEVLPLSPYDDRIRIAVARAVYGYGPLQRYALGTLPSIRIVVKHGEVNLEGVVANDADRTIVNLRANGVAGVFKVTNNLTVARG